MAGVSGCRVHCFLTYFSSPYIMKWVEIFPKVYRLKAWSPAYYAIGGNGTFRQCGLVKGSQVTRGMALKESGDSGSFFTFCFLATEI